MTVPHQGDPARRGGLPGGAHATAHAWQVGDYRVRRSLGRGGMGEVFLAEAPAGSLVAVKVMHPHLASDPEFLARMRSEVAAAGRVSAWSTARVLDADLDAPTPYVVTEYVEGPTLAALVEAAGPMSPASAHGLALGVALALAGIHDAGVVHRDLKPGNVILSPSGPRVIDFGVALHDDRAPDLTRTGVLVGSAGWMSPEQVRGEPVSTATDVFSWGGLVHYAATGRRPFGTGSTTTLAYRIAHVGPDLSGTPEELRPTVRAAMDPDPALRPTARDLVAILQRRAVPGGWAGGPARTGAGGDETAVVPSPTPAAGSDGDRDRWSATRVAPAPAPPHAAARVRPWHRRPAAAVALAGVVAAGVAVLVAAALARDDGEQVAAGTQAAAGDEGAVPTPAPAEPTPETTTAPTTAPAPSTSTPPSVVEVGDWAVEPLAVDCGVSTLGEGWTTVEADGEFCVMSVSVTNTGDATGDFAAGAQEAGDATGVRHRADGWAWVYHAGSREFSGLAPGANVTGDLVFDVPPGTVLTDLAVRDGWTGDAIVLPLLAG